MSERGAGLLRGRGIPGIPRKKWLDFALGALVGAAVFLLLYGPSTLNPAYDSWIYSGYIENDIVQSQAGWMFFRNSPWTWPLTVAENFQQPYGGSIVFTDSLPLAAILCKLFAPVLPAQFQYFGWCNFINFILMGGFAVLLVRHFDLGRLYSVVASLLFLLWPVFIERSFRHTALAAQWIILAALLCYFEGRRRDTTPVGFAVLCALTPAVHTYFLPMVYALLAASLLERMLRQRKILRPAAYLGVCALLTLGVAYALGILTRGGGGGAGGFGSYSMNLNALFNPTSFDYFAESEALHWSRLLPVRGQFYHQYDGFNYLGAGVLLALAGMAVYGAVRFVRALVRGDRAPLRRAGAFLKSHVGLLAVCFCLTIFAFSNVVCWDEVELLNVPLPAMILQLCAVFRASGRMFWPVGYLLLLSVVLFCGRVPKGKLATGALALVLAVQFVDISGTLAKKHAYFAEGPPVRESFLQAEGWDWLLAHYDSVTTLADMRNYDLAISMITANPGIKTNFIFTNRGEYPLIQNAYAPEIERLATGGELAPGVLYLCNDVNIYRHILAGAHPDARGYEIVPEQIYFIALPVEGCPVAADLPGGGA